MNKILNDTLKSPNGKWSRKSLTMFASFAVSVILGAYIVCCNLFTATPISEKAIDVFQGFMMLTGVLSGVSVWDKQAGGNSQTTNQE